MKDIAIYGAGGFGREIACLINHINRAEGLQWNMIGFFDDGKDPGYETGYGRVIGGMDKLNAYPHNLSVVIAIANPKTLRKLVDQIENPLVEFPNIIAPNVLFFDRESVTMGCGNVLTFGCRLSCNVKLGNFNLLNGCVSFGHDVAIDSYNVMMPETRLSGEVKVGEMNLFGSRSFVVQQVTIGSRTTIAAGSFILRKTKDDSLYMGNPAKKMDIN